MPWPWEREHEERPPLVVVRLEAALSLLDKRIADLRAEVDRLKAMRQAKEQENGPCPTS